MGVRDDRRNRALNLMGLQIAAFYTFPKSPSPQLGPPLEDSGFTTRCCLSCAQVPDDSSAVVPHKQKQYTPHSSAVISQELSVDRVYRMPSSCLVPLDPNLLVTLNL